ncbi:hypothetical protein IEQ34_018531 [Dendrobium chrysotoxum]|uniref:Uncharacterized protein n=1 Tax=Dendrobium chrysotoxum TaxID=161865 RepID=A0AAV7G6X2_DENCH|nr:hypothetical protein IEQ34_018531 [Dendrobium chrysotoxum]
MGDCSTGHGLDLRLWQSFYIELNQRLPHQAISSSLAHKTFNFWLNPLECTPAALWNEHTRNSERTKYSPKNLRTFNSVSGKSQQTREIKQQ